MKNTLNICLLNMKRMVCIQTKIKLIVLVLVLLNEEEQQIIVRVISFIFMILFMVIHSFYSFIDDGNVNIAS